MANSSMSATESRTRASRINAIIVPAPSPVACNDASIKVDFAKDLISPLKAKFRRPFQSRAASASACRTACARPSCRPTRYRCGRGAPRPPRRQRPAGRPRPAGSARPPEPPRSAPFTKITSNGPLAGTPAFSGPETTSTPVTPAAASPSLRRLGRRLVLLQRNHRRGKPGQHGARIARSGSDIEHAVFRPHGGDVDQLGEIPRRGHPAARRRSRPPCRHRPRRAGWPAGRFRAERPSWRAISRRSVTSLGRTWLSIIAVRAA